jgi:hypothetical protein
MNSTLVRGIVLISAAGLVTAAACRKNPSPASDKHVVIIGIDGMGSDYFQMGVTPNIKRLAREGALALEARSVMPSVSLPSWGSILAGAGPEEHGITSNSWHVDKFNIPPTDGDEDGFFPSIFTLIRKTEPAAETAIFYDWDDLINAINTKNISRVDFSRTFGETFDKAVPYILGKKPRLTFLYVGLPDEVGHEYGWDSDEFYRSLTEVDARVGGLLEALRGTDWWDKCIVLTVVDHGGTGTGHGGETPSEMNVPWIISGPGILKGRIIEQPVSIRDTAPTIARILGLEAPWSWTGRPVRGAFEAETVFAGENTRVFVPKPKPSLRSGLYTEPREAAFTVDDPEAEIRYIVSGGEAHPDASSPLYEKSVPLSESCVVTAVAMKAGAVSDPTVVVYERILAVRAVTLGKSPDGNRSSLGPLALVDGKWGNPDSGDRSWTGFSRNDLEAVVDFGAAREIRKLGLSVYDDARAGIYPPTMVEFSASEDGRRYRPLARLGSDAGGAAPVRLLAREIKPVKIRYLKVRAANRGYCPPESSRDGDKALLLVDEILFE